MNPSIDIIRGSDGTGNASVATVQSTRAPLATTLNVNTVQGIPSTFYGSMGTPHTFIDPVTGETITIISEASAVDFRGHVDGTNLEIDEIAPGYTDAGSAVGDIVIIKPITEWANNVANVLEVVHEDDGTLKDDVVDTSAVQDNAITTPKINNGAVTFAKTTGIWWEEIGRTTLSVAGDTITVSSLPARKFLRVFVLTLQSGAITSTMRFNNDSGANYADRSSSNFGADTTTTSQTSFNLAPGGGAENQYAVLDILNVATIAKPVIISGIYFPNSAASAPSVRDGYAKWSNTSVQINRIDVINPAAGDFAIGSQVVVLGHD